MNKNRQVLSSQKRKKMEKAIKKGQEGLSIPEDEPRTDTLTPKKALNKYPSKRQKVEKPLMDSTVKNMQAKKAKKQSKHSKRTTPGEVGHRESPPASVHPESTRWKKTVDLQNKGHRKSLTAKLQKRK